MVLKKDGPSLAVELGPLKLKKRRTPVKGFVEIGRDEGPVGAVGNRLRLPVFQGAVDAEGVQAAVGGVIWRHFEVEPSIAAAAPAASTGHWRPAGRGW